jgi:short-subunit dehydrogenase
MILALLDKAIFKDMTQLKPMENKRICITGGNSGLGLEITKILLRKGAVVYVFDKEEQSFFDKNLHYSRFDFLNPDLSFLNGMEFDILISNLGTYHGLRKFHDMEYRQIRNMVTLNISVPLYLIKNVHAGKYVIINSVLSQQGFPYLSMYCACKSFMSVLNQSLRREGVDTLIVYPYKFNSGLFSDIKDIFTLKKGNVAECVVDAILKGKKEITLPFVFRYTHVISMMFLPLQDFLIKLIGKICFKLKRS